VGPVNKVTSLVATAIACVLPTVAIAVLTTTLAVTTQQKLLWIGGFTILFAMGVVAFTSEISKAHVFMAAATYVFRPTSNPLAEYKLITILTVQLLRRLGCLCARVGQVGRTWVWYLG